jgi:peroxiredoxin
MALESNMLALGTELPNVTLPDLNGTHINLVEFAGGNPLVVIFACNHCPYVQHLENGIGALSAEFTNIGWIAIASNDTDAYPDDDVPGLRAQQSRAGWHFPYVLDLDQSVAKTFQAACTPDFYLFDPNGHLVYRGAFDDARPNQPTPVTGDRLRSAIVATLDNQPPVAEQQPSLGCGIKWRPGNEPA